MSFLAPLYALGLLAVAGPILFHLIRRRPKGEVPFSSLMFLSPSPPPPARKRRIDQLLLLLLRSAALVLLGVAFMRPFLRQDATAGAPESGHRVVVLIDTSASMRRGDLWKQAVAKADAALSECQPTDRLAVFAFDRTVRPVFGFAESDQLEPQQRLAIARDRVKQLAPTWGGTELGKALIDGVTAILDADAKGGRAGRVVLVSDLSQGAKLTGLTGFEWPAEVGLELRTVSDDRGNAGLDLLVDRADAERGSEPNQLRVRVVNDANSRNETFQLAWAGTTGGDVEAYVPPGESRVVKVSRPPTGSTPTLKLRGDAHEFDNSLFLATQQREELTVVYVGTDAADDATGLRYFLERAWAETPERKVTVLARKPNEPLVWNEVKSAPLVVVSGEPSADNHLIVKRYLNDGGTVLTVLSPADAEEAKVARYTMLQDITFDHPLFAPLSGPQYGDFTKVQFWKHRRITDKQLDGCRVLARFDDGDSAVIEKMIGKGRSIVFAAGWQPSDSQLARSSKFVPLMTALLELRGGRRVVAVNSRVGDRVVIVSGTTAVRKPDGTTVALDRTTTSFDGTDQPGVYTADTPTGPRAFAVNLDPAESLTAPLPPETLEQMGCKLAKRGENEELRRETERQQRNAELERSQSIWRWLVLAAVAVLLIETGLAGWRTWSNPQTGSAP